MPLPKSNIARINMEFAINVVRDTCYGLSFDAGWWENNATGELYDPHDPLVFSSKISLIHSEVSEALEGNRKGMMDKHLPHRQAAEVELADTIIRIMDLAGACGFDIGGALLEKLEYNQNREDHKPENRRKKGGKAI